MWKKRAATRSRFSLTKILTILTLAVGLFEKVERTAFTTAQDVIALASPSNPVTYAEVESLRVDKLW
jgi:hypothetical protein